MADEKGAQKLPKRDLERLIKKSMKGDSAAFAELYKIFINTIYFNVSSSLIDKSETEDAVQQVVFSLHRGLPRLKSPYAFHSYLYRIIVNVCNKHNKKGAIQQQGTTVEIEDDLLIDEDDTPPEVLERKEQGDLVRQFISKLPEKQRYMLVLYYYYDMPYKRIAEVMETSVTVVGSNLNRAKQKIKQMLEEYEEKMSGTRKNNEVYHRGVAIDAILAAGIAGSIEESLTPVGAEILWQQMAQKAPEILVNSLGKSKLAASSKVAAGVVVAAAVVTSGVMLGLYLDNPTFPQDPPPITEQVVFAPEVVEISFQGDQDLPDVYNPLSAEIELSEGFPLEWRITQNDGDTILIEGTGSFAGRDAFRSLEPGEYRMEWRISDEAGNTGLACREFFIVEIE